METGAQDVPRIYAHRGDSSRFPENTMAAFRSACELGVDGIEFDVHMTRDGHLVVLHDYDLARTTTGTGLVHERDLDYVCSLSAGAWFAEEFAGEGVPVVEEVLALEGIEFEMELKGLPTKQFVFAVAAAVRDAGVLDRVRFTGFHWVSLMELRRELPEARLGLFPRDYEPWMSERLYEQIITATALTGGYQVIHLPNRLLRKVDVDRLHVCSLLLQAGEAGGSTEEALDWRVDGLTTDCPSEALEARSAWLAGRNH